MCMYTFAGLGVGTKFYLFLIFVSLLSYIEIETLPPHSTLLTFRHNDSFNLCFQDSLFVCF